MRIIRLVAAPLFLPLFICSVPECLSCVLCSSTGSFSSFLLLYFIVPLPFSILFQGSPIQRLCYWSGTEKLPVAKHIVSLCVRPATCTALLLHTAVCYLSSSAWSHWQCVFLRMCVQVCGGTAQFAS